VSLLFSTHLRLRLCVISDELEKPAKSLYKHSLVAVLETAIQGSNVQYEEQDITSRLSVRMLKVKYCVYGDTAWNDTLDSVGTTQNTGLNTIY